MYLVISLPNDVTQGELDTVDWLVGVIKGMEEKNWMHRLSPGDVAIHIGSRRSMKIVYNTNITRGDIHKDIVKVVTRQITYCHEQFGVRARFILTAPGGI